TSEWRQKNEALVRAANEARQQAGSQSAEGESTVRKLSASNIELLKQVELWKQVAAKSSRPTVAPAMPPEAERELAMLRARVDVLQAQPVPYAAEELALFAKSPPSLAVTRSQRASVSTSPSA